MMTKVTHLGRKGNRERDFVNPPLVRGSTVVFPTVKERLDAWGERYDQVSGRTILSSAAIPAHLLTRCYAININIDSPKGQFAAFSPSVRGARDSYDCALSSPSSSTEPAARPRRIPSRWDDRTFSQLVALSGKLNPFPLCTGRWYFKGCGGGDGRRAPRAGEVVKLTEAAR
jgi:hypothetical protein